MTSRGVTPHDVTPRGVTPHDAGRETSISRATIVVEVAYAEPRRAVVKAYSLPPAATVGDALKLAAADADFAGIDLTVPAVGVFGIRAPPDRRLEQGDRVEIYRPLAADPKVARRARANQARRGGP